MLLTCHKYGSDQNIIVLRYHLYNTQEEHSFNGFKEDRK